MLNSILPCAALCFMKDKAQGAAPRNLVRTDLYGVIILKTGKNLTRNDKAIFANFAATKLTSYAKISLIGNRLYITLVFLPPYPPNLNLIERLWKFVKKKVLYAKYYFSPLLFHKAILDFMQNIQDNLFHQELKSLLNSKFQTLQNVRHHTKNNIPILIGKGCAPSLM